MKILKSAWKFIVLIILIGFGLLYYASNKVEDKYQAAIGLMNNGEWSNAVNLIIETPHYKDASELYIYMYPHKLFYSGYTTEADAIKGFSNAAEFIKLERDKLKDTNSEKYIVELNELEKVLIFKIKVLNAKILDEPIKKNLDEGLDLIKKGSYQEAVLKLQSIGDGSIYGTDKQELIKYVTLLSVIPSNNLDDITEGISTLNPNYEGVLAQEIKLTVQTYLDIIEWNEIYNAKKTGDSEDNNNTDQIPKTPENVQNTNTVISKSVAVGMKREEVVAILGNPTTSNIISNKYGNYEEMIYGVSRFIYFENNIVSAVK